MTGDFYLTYRSHLERYIYEGAAENILLEAYQDIMRSLDEKHAQAAGILDVHTRALREIMGVQRDSDNVQWIYIDRATEFLAQILIVIDAFLLQLKERMERDPLTGLHNRLGLSRLLPRVLQEAQKHGSHLVVAMVDLDNFKEVNDRLGHHAGDEVLCQVATLIKRLLRGQDVVVRFGGEEFVILLPATSIAQAKVPLERIRAQVAAEMVLPQAGSVTVSIGVVEYPGNGPVVADDLLRRADQAMYRAKEEGKNRIVFAE